VYAGLDSINARGWALGDVDPSFDYFEFRLTPSAGTTLDINEIALGERRSATGVGMFTLRSSLDGFVADAIVPIEVPVSVETRSHTLVLGSAFDAISSAVTFRLYGYRSGNVSGRWGITNHSDFGAFVVSGTVAGAGSGPSDTVGDMHAPEPAGGLIWGLAAGFWGICSVIRWRGRPMFVYRATGL
jgi:hypothetical protein